MELTRTNFGFTFSQRQAAYLDLAWRETYRAAIDLAPGTVRLGAYWDEIEPEPARFDFATLDWLLDQAAARDLRIMLTVGMKAPRWPEYYLPAWLDRRLPKGARVTDEPEVRVQTLDFIRQVTERYRGREVIAYWQVENEPLDPAGPFDWRIGPDFLAEEVALVRALDPRRRPIIGNMFVETSPLALLPAWREAARERARALLERVDILGLDVYPSIGARVLGRDVYLDWSEWGWERQLVELHDLARQAGKPAWIIEAQAEPWEPGRVVYLDAQPARSVRPSTAVRLVRRLQTAGFENILLWGVEYWYMRRQRHRDPDWWQSLPAFFTGSSRHQSHDFSDRPPP